MCVVPSATEARAVCTPVCALCGVGPSSLGDSVAGSLPPWGYGRWPGSTALLQPRPFSGRVCVGEAMALVKCKSCGSDVAGNAAACPKCGAPPPRGASVLKVTFLGLGGVFALCFFGTCMAGAIGAASKGATRRGATAEATRATTEATRAPAEATRAPVEAPRPATSRPSPKDVEIRSLLTEYADNEVRADLNFKNHVIQTSGIVDDVKKDILDSVYITVGTGRRFEIPQVQCFIADDQVNKAANLSKGSRVSVRGRVQGLMMNVLVHDCEIVEL